MTLRPHLSFQLSPPRFRRAAHPNPPAADVDESFDLFSGLSRRELARVRRLLTVVDVPAGASLGREDALVREFALILKGHVAVIIGDTPIGMI